jgi:hypothetical protein
MVSGQGGDDDVCRSLHFCDPKESASVEVYVPLEFETSSSSRRAIKENRGQVGYPSTSLSNLLSEGLSASMVGWMDDGWMGCVGVF